MRGKCHITGKVLYGNQRDADEGVKGLRRKRREMKAIRSYKCEYCGGYHLTSQAEKVQELQLKHEDKFKKFIKPDENE